MNKTALAPLPPLVLDEKFLREWKEALRSGKYQQTKGLLHRTEGFRDRSAGYCCLGVALRVAGVTDEQMGNEGNINNLYNNGNYDGGSEVFNHEIHTSCAQMNDRHGKSFAEIADYLDTLTPADLQPK